MADYKDIKRRADELAMEAHNEQRQTYLKSLEQDKVSVRLECLHLAMSVLKQDSDPMLIIWAAERFYEFISRKGG